MYHYMLQEKIRRNMSTGNRDRYFRHEEAIRHPPYGGVCLLCTLRDAKILSPLPVDLFRRVFSCDLLCTITCYRRRLCEIGPHRAEIDISVTKKPSATRHTAGYAFFAPFVTPKSYLRSLWTYFAESSPVTYYIPLHVTGEDSAK